MTIYHYEPNYISPEKEAAQEDAAEAKKASNYQLATELRSLITYLEEKDRAFATSLVNWVISSQANWSQKQRYWGEKLVERGRANKVGKQAATATAIVRKFPNIAKLFLSNPNIHNLAWPKISYKLSEAGPTVELCYNKNYNCIQARLPGKKLIGTIRLPAGVEDTRWPIKEENIGYLNQIEADPIAAAKLSGKLTSCCSFCSRELTDELSVKAGYGPICAEHWGLPWGGKRTGETKVEVEL